MKYSAIISSGEFACGTAVIQGSTEECFHKAKKAGYDGVQLTIRDTTDYSADEITKLMTETGLVVSAMATGRIYTVDGLSMGSDREENRCACVERLRKLIHFSTEIGRPALVIGAVRGLYKDAKSQEKYYEAFHKSMEELVACGEENQVPIILEADDHLEADSYLDPGETLQYVRTFSSSYCHMYLDTMHLYNEEMDVAEAIRTYGKEAFQIDISGEDRTSPAESGFHFQEIMKAVQTSGFDGFLAMEISPLANAKEAVDFLKKFEQ